MAGAGYRNLAIGFGEVFAHASSLDPRDRVVIHSSDDPDQVEFIDDYGSFASTDLYRYFQGFGKVTAYVDAAQDDVTEESVQYDLTILDR